MIVVGGEALVDLFDDNGAARPVAGGGPFNTAVALGRLGVPVGFLGSISGDEYGQMLATLLRASDVDTQLVRWSAAPTPCAVVHRGPDGRHDYTFDFEGTALADLTPHQLPELPRGVWAVHVGTVALALDPPAAAFEALVDREAGRRRIVLDPNVRPAVFGDASAYRGRFERLARLADVVKLSEDDAAWIWPGLAAEDVLGLLCGLGSEVVAITRAERGAIAASAAGVVDVAGVPVEVVDTVGAGDSFGAALIASLVDEGVLTPTDTKTAAVDQLGRAVSFAVAASAITCTRVGADPPTRAEVAVVAARSRS